MAIKSKITFFLLLISIFFNGCSIIPKEYYLSKNFKKALQNRSEYKLILISNELPIKKQVEEIFNEYSWETVDTDLDTSNIEWNKQYLGLPKYVLDIKKDEIFTRTGLKEYYYHIYIYNTKTHKNELEINKMGKEQDILKYINKFVKEVK